VIAALEAAVHRVLDHLGSELTDLGLRQAEINVLAQLRPGSPRTVGGLAAATGQRPSTLTGVLDRLERGKLLRRRLNPADRRSFTVALTARAASARLRASTQRSPRSTSACSQSSRPRTPRAFTACSTRSST
jgi:DNA-binding MarR family transcriptional regulator